jgi:Uma2 family endonuclease
MVAAVDAAHPGPSPWSLDEWVTFTLAGGLGDGRRLEFVAGSLLVSPAPSPWHQIAADRLQTALQGAAPADLIAITAIGVPLPESKAGLIPDVLLVDREAVLPYGTLPAASALRLAVEVVSPSTTTTDRHIKPEKYAAAGIPHFWRLELLRFRGQLPGEVLPVLFIYVLGESGEYELVHRADASAPVKIAAPVELTLDVADLRP